MDEDSAEKVNRGRLKHQKQKEEESSEPATPSEVFQSYEYFQMEILVSDITEEFEAEITKRISRQVKILEATPEDCDRLVYLHNRAFLSATDPYSPINYDDMMMVLNFRENIVLIASLWGEDAGFIILGFDFYPGLDPETEGSDVPDGPAIAPVRDGHSVYNVGYISGLGVDPRWQRRGIGTTLGITSWRYFKARNLTKLKCEVYAKNDASYNLISGLGFKRVGSTTYTLEQQRAEPLRRL